MTEKFVASKYVGRFAVVRNPAQGTEWTGRIVGYHEMPSVTLEQADGFRLSLPAAWVRRAGEPKPWHDAKPGEVWVLTVDGSEYAWGVGTGVDVGRFRFVGGESNIPVTSADITAGRKIWPEAPND